MDTEKKYLVRRGEQQYGPYTLDVLLHYHKQGQILGTDLAWSDGQETWISVAQLSIAKSAGAEPPASGGPQAQVVIPRRSRLKPWIWGAGIAAFLMAAVILVVLLSGPRPEDSLNQARAAYLQRDKVNFDKYVDVTSVLSDGVDQIANVIMQQNNTSGLARLAIEAALPPLKSIYLPTTSRAVDQFVITGSLPQDSQSTSPDPATTFIAATVSAALRKVAASSLSYQGVESKHVSGNTTTLNVRVATPLSSQPILLKVRMQKGYGYWRVVAIEDLATLLRELEGRVTQGASSSVSAAVSPVSAPPSAPAPEPEQPSPSAAASASPPTSASASAPPSASPESAPSADATAPSVPEPAAGAPTAAVSQDAPAPTPAAPASDDDPVGNGGFISPPAR